MLIVMLFSFIFVFARVKRVQFNWKCIECVIKCK